MSATKLIPTLITGNMPERLIENIRVPGYDLRHIENPADADLAAPSGPPR